MKDEIVIAALLSSFASLVAMHVAIVAGLASKSPRWRAAVALVVAPLAPYWAIREGMRVRGAFWLLGAVVYAIAFQLAAR